MRTEDEAKEKWCPFSETRFSDRCLGSACMAWRRSNDTLTLKPGEAAPEGFELSGGTPECTIYASTYGYCGLAGKDGT